MLDFMRRHSGGLLIKLLLGLIAVSFIAFFGYSAVTDRRLGAKTAAIVGDEIIPLQQYQKAYTGAINNLQGSFEEGIPENMEKIIRSNVLRQLIQSKILIEFARSFGFRIADAEVARMIRKQKQFYDRNGVFDMSFYQKRHRPAFRDEHGVDYEKVIRQVLLMDLYNTFLMTSTLHSEDEEKWYKEVDQIKWKFDVITVPEADDPDQQEEIKTTLSEWIGLWSKKPISKEKLDKLGANIRNNIEISLTDRNKLLEMRLPEEYVRPILKMETKNSVYPEPIRIGNKWYLIKLLKKTQIPRDQIASTQPTDQTSRAAMIDNEFFNLWLDDFSKQLKIKSNIPF